MKPLLACVLVLTAWSPNSAVADPIHAAANGDYWHHDSGWVFPERLARFVRIGFPQDVAGSRDAVGYYQRETDGGRIVVDVDIFAADSAAEDISGTQTRASWASAASRPGALLDDTLDLGQGRVAARLRFTPAGGTPVQACYFVTVGDWRVRIRATGPALSAALASELDDFVRSQDWDKLAR